jgi:hypothetical protein
MAVTFLVSHASTPASGVSVRLRGSAPGVPEEEWYDTTIVTGGDGLAAFSGEEDWSSWQMDTSKACYAPATYNYNAEQLHNVDLVNEIGYHEVGITWVGGGECGEEPCDPGEQPGPCYVLSEDGCSWEPPDTDCAEGEEWDEDECECVAIDPDECALSLTVRSLSTGNPVSGALVTFSDGTSGTTDASGEVTFPEMTAGTLTWNVSGTNYLPVWDSGECGEHETWLPDDDETVSEVSYCFSDPDCAGSAGPTPTECYPAITSVQIVEDADGIPPIDQSHTYDSTPTFAWTADGGVEPYLYVWEVRSSDGTTLLASGTTVANLVELPELDYDEYQFRVHVTDSEGHCSLWTGFGFESTVFVPDVVIEEPPVLEPVIPRAPELLRYLPRWYSVYGDEENPGTATTLYQYFEPQLVEWARFNRSVEEVAQSLSLLEAPVAQPRLAWTLHTRMDVNASFTVNVRLDGASGTLSGEVRRAESLYDFTTAYEPIYVLDEQGRMVFRNLCSRMRSITPDGEDVYHLTGETSGLVRDADLTVLKDGLWYILPVDGGSVNVYTGSLMLPATYSGAATIRYLSRRYQETVEVSVAGEPWQTPYTLDLWNRFDELGLLIGITRRAGEDNGHYRERLYARCLSKIGTAQDSLEQHVAEDLSLVTVLEWDGISTLNLAASGHWGIQDIYIQDVPELGHAVEEELLPTGTAGLYSSHKRTWLEGYYLHVDGRTATTLTYPDLSVSGNLVDFGTAVPGRVWANYRYRNYTLTRSSQDTITTVTPVSGNLLPGSYQVLLVRGVVAHTLDERNFINTELLDGAGRPNGYFRQLRETLLQGSPVHVGRSGWNGSYWLDREDDRPQVSYLPLVFDQTGEE